MGIQREWLHGLGIALLLGLPVGAPAAAGPAGISSPVATFRRPSTDLDQDRRLACEELLLQLEELAEWCKKKKAYSKRQQVYESMLHFDPESTVANRGLGFVKNSAGEWIEKKRRVEPKDWDKSAVLQFPKRRTEVVVNYRETMFGLLEKYADVISPAEREGVLEDVLCADPDDPRVHELRDETKVDGHWLLVQTVNAKKHRSEMREMVRKAFGSVPKAREGVANKKEESFGIAWKAIYTTPIVRSLGTGSEEEVQRMTEAMAATLSYFNAALSVEAHYPKDFTVYTLNRSSDKMAFLMNHSAIDQGYRDFLFKLDGSGIQGSGDLAHWSEEPTRRLDGMVRQAIGWLFAESYGVTPKHGWVFEGFGLYLTRELVGTRLTWYVRPSEYLVETDDMALKQRLLDTRTNWMNEALKMLGREERPNLALLLGRDVNQLTTEDLLYSYALASYLLEAESPKIPGIMTKIGKGVSSVEALESELGGDLAAIDERVRRWLSERR